MALKCNDLNGMPVNCAGFGSIELFYNTSTIATSGEDGFIQFTNVLNMEKNKNPIELDGPIITFTKTIDEKHIILCNQETNEILLYSYPDLVFKKIIYRSTFTILHISSSIHYVAIAGENSIGTLIDLQNNKNMISLNGHKDTIKSICIDPMEKCVITSSLDETILLYELINDSINPITAKVIKKFQIEMDMNAEESFCRPDWVSVTGKWIAIPNKKNNINICNRDNNWTIYKIIKLPIHYNACPSYINIIKFSPNGQYIAAATMAKEIFIWHIETEKCISFYKAKYDILGLQWNHSTISENDAIAVYHSGGEIAFEKIDFSILGLPSSYISNKSNIISSGKMLDNNNTKKIPNNMEEASNENLTEDMELVKNSNCSSNSPEERINEEDELNLTAIKASFGYDETKDDDKTENNDIWIPDEIDDIETYKQSIKIKNRKNQSVIPPFQSGAVSDGPVILLAWNILGDIESIKKEDSHIIKIEFNDKTKKRNMKFNDNFSFSLADFNEEGVFFASKINSLDDNEDNRTSILFYKNFENWGIKNSWQLSLKENENALTIAIGKNYCAVGTSHSLVRIYTTSGEEYCTISIPGSIITMSGHGSNLAVVYKNRNDMNIYYKLMEICLHVQNKLINTLNEGILPLYNGSNINETDYKELKWIGFDEFSSLYIYDDSGTLQSLQRGAGFNWVPVLNLNTSVTKNRSSYFPIGLFNNSFFYFPLEKNKIYPNLLRKQRPIPNIINLKNTSFDNDKNKKINTIWESLRIGSKNDYYDCLIKNSEDIMEKKNIEKLKDTDIVRSNADLDKLFLLLIKNSCIEDNIQKAYDYVKLLTLEKSFLIATKVANFYNFRELENKIQLLQDRKFHAQIEEDDYDDDNSHNGYDEDGHDDYDNEDKEMKNNKNEFSYHNQNTFEPENEKYTSANHKENIYTESDNDIDETIYSSKEKNLENSSSVETMNEVNTTQDSTIQQDSIYPSNPFKIQDTNGDSQDNKNKNRKNPFEMLQVMSRTNSTHKKLKKSVVNTLFKKK